MFLDLNISHLNAGKDLGPAGVFFLYTKVHLINSSILFMLPLQCYGVTLCDGVLGLIWSIGSDPTTSTLSLRCSGFSYSSLGFIDVMAQLYFISFQVEDYLLT